MTANATTLESSGLLPLMMVAVGVLAIGCVAASPPAPTNAMASAGDRRVVVTWDAIEEATSYNVYWSTVQRAGTAGYLVNVTSTSFDHIPIANARPYYYVVTAVSDLGESEPTEEVTATPEDIPLGSLSFADPALASCVAEQPFDFVHELQSLYCGGRAITSLEGIQSLYHLKRLSLPNNAITDLDPLGALTTLYLLTLDNNPITDLTPIANLLELTFLSVPDNQIRDIAPLSGLTKLRSVNARNNQIAKLAPIASLSQLGYILLTQNQIEDISAVATLTSLYWLDLNNNFIVDVAPLANLQPTATIDLENNLIGGAGVGHLDTLVVLDPRRLALTGNLGISCAELDTLITAVGSPPVDVDGDSLTSDIPEVGINCTAP